jgi:hypothetical protein
MWSNSRRPADRPPTFPQLEVLESRNLLSSFVAPPSPASSTSVSQLVQDATTLLVNSISGAVGGITADSLKENLKTVKDDFRNLPSLQNPSVAQIGGLLLAGFEVSGAGVILSARAVSNQSIASIAKDMQNQGQQISTAGVKATVNVENATFDSIKTDVDNSGAPPQLKATWDSLLQFLENALDQLMGVGAGNAAEFTPPSQSNQDPDNDGDVDMY